VQHGGCGARDHVVDAGFAEYAEQGGHVGWLALRYTFGRPRHRESVGIPRRPRSRLRTRERAGVLDGVASARSALADDGTRSDARRGVRRCRRPLRGGS
jgi:hypothetical protein